MAKKNLFFLMSLMACVMLQAESIKANWKKYLEAEFTVGAGGDLALVNKKAGAGVTANLPCTPGVRYRFSFEARGEGTCCAYGYGVYGWFYGTKVPLDAKEWKPISIAYGSSYKNNGFYIINQLAEAKYEVRNIKLTPEPVEGLLEADMEPKLFLAADYPGKFGKLVNNVEGAMQGKALQGKRWYLLCRLPVPTNTKGLFYYVHIRKNADKPFQLQLKHYSELYPVSKAAAVTAANAWTWVKIGPVSAGLAAPQVDLNLQGDAAVEALVDRIVISTQDKLEANPAELDKLTP